MNPHLPGQCPPSLRAPLVAACLLAGMLAGCSDHDSKTPSAPPAAAQANPARTLAMARGKIEVQGGLLDVMAIQDGVVESLSVKEGDEVHRGQVLLKLASDQAHLDIGLAEAELRLVQARQRAQAARLPAARQLAQRMHEAEQAGALDPQRYDEALQAQRDIESAVAVLDAEAAVARQKLAQTRLIAQKQTLTAALDASVLKLNVQTGSRVSTQATRAVMVLLPHRPLVVRAELNESYVSSIQLGMHASVSVESDAANSARLPPATARVVRISQAYAASRLDEDTPQRNNVRVVDCFLEFDPAQPPLRVGQDVRVSFHD